jgi:hypothetical protein
VDEVALGQVFFKYFGFPCQFSFHQLLHTHHHLLSGAGTEGHIVANVPSGFSLTPPKEIKNHFGGVAEVTSGQMWGMFLE